MASVMLCSRRAGETFTKLSGSSSFLACVQTYCTKGTGMTTGNDALQIQSQITNRNPRNLEKMRIDRKPRGWELDSPPREYWHKVFFTDSSRRVSGKVVHNNGRVVVKASSSEWAIRKHLYSATDMCAAENVARILAMRCLQSGILFVHSFFTPDELKKEKVQLFIKSLEENGLTLTEPRREFPQRLWL